VRQRPREAVALPESHPASKGRSKLKPRIELWPLALPPVGRTHWTEVLRRIGNEFPVPIVVVQHMPPIFTRLLAERLRAVRIAVEEGRAGALLCPGHAGLAGKFSYEGDSTQGWNGVSA